MGEHHALPVLGRRDSETRVEGRPQGVVHRLAFGDRVEIDTQGQDRTVAVVPQVRILADQADQHRGLACARVLAIMAFVPCTALLYTSYRFMKGER